MRHKSLLLTILFSLFLSACEDGNGGGGTTDGSSNSNGGEASNAAPVFNNPALVSIVEGIAYQLLPQASDADHDTLSYSASNLPTWLNIDSNIGAVTGTPGNSDIGSHNDITITVDDGATTTDYVFSITVSASAAYSVSYSGNAKHTLLGIAADNDQVTRNNLNATLCRCG